MKQGLLTLIKNKYFLALVAFVLWVGFFDKNDFYSQLELHRQVKELEKEKQYYLTEIEKNKQELNALQNDPKMLEKFAREKYFMRKDNEDVFVIVKE